MNVRRWTPLLFKSFFVKLGGFGVLDVVGDVAVAVLGTGVEVQQLLRRFGVRQVRNDFFCTSKPRGHLQFSADIRKRILERVGVPHSDAVTILETFYSFAREQRHIWSQQAQMLRVESFIQNLQL